MSRLAPAFALRVSPPGAGAIHLLWLGGEGAGQVLQKLIPSGAQSERAVVQLGKLVAGGETIDEAMWRELAPQERSFPGPAFEISLHGSEAVLQKTLNALAAMGTRILDTQEFLALAHTGDEGESWRQEAWRAFLEAKSSAGARLFLAQIQGAFAAEIADLNSSLESRADAKAALQRIESLLERGRAAIALRHPQRVVLAGRPNAGKSTLFNALVGYERAIVSPQEGTTRDPVEETVMLGGYPFLVTDTAGLRESEDPIEREGARLALEAAARAELAVFVWDGRRPWDAAQEEALASLRGASVLRFPVRIDSLAQSVARLESALLDALHLPNPAPQNGPAPVSPAQLDLLERAAASLRAGRDARPDLRALFF